MIHGKKRSTWNRMKKTRFKPKELVEGPQAVKNFETAMKTAFRVSKAELDEAERKRTAKRKQKK